MSERISPFPSTSASTSTSTSTSNMVYRQFVDTCRSEATRSRYVQALHYFMSYLHLQEDAYDKLIENDPKISQMNVCDFITYLRKRGAAFATVSLYVAAINKFYSMNDITLNWKKISSFMGEHEKVTDDRPYTHSEIQTLVQNCGVRNRSMILLMSSAGLRIGALSILRVKDLEPIDKYQIYKVNVYAKSRKSKYFSFCTPEARKEIDSYLDHRRRWGERILDDSDSPLFRTDYNPQAADRTRAIKHISITRLAHIVGDILKDTGLRKVPLEGKPQRSHIMANHGFRKFFETNAFKAGMENMYIRRLMGQKSGLEDSYLKLSEEDLLEGDSKHVGYVDVIDQLCIDPKSRLERENKQLKQEVTKFDHMQKQIEELTRRMGLT
jgi:integrase